MPETCRGRQKRPWRRVRNFEGFCAALRHGGHPFALSSKNMNFNKKKTTRRFFVQYSARLQISVWQI